MINTINRTVKVDEQKLNFPYPSPKQWIVGVFLLMSLAKTGIIDKVNWKWQEAQRSEEQVSCQS